MEKGKQGWTFPIAGGVKGSFSWTSWERLIADVEDVYSTFFADWLASKPNRTKQTLLNPLYISRPLHVLCNQLSELVRGNTLNEENARKVVVIAECIQGLVIGTALISHHEGRSEIFEWIDERVKNGSVVFGKDARKKFNELRHFRRAFKAKPLSRDQKDKYNYIHKAHQQKVAPGTTRSLSATVQWLCRHDVRFKGEDWRKLYKRFTTYKYRHPKMFT